MNTEFTLISQSVAGILTEKLKISYAYTGVISLIITKVLNSSFEYYYFLLFIPLIFYYYPIPNLWKKNKKDPKVLSSYFIKEMYYYGIFRNYITDHPDFFNKSNINMIAEVYGLNQIESISTFESNQTIDFNDTCFKVKGFITIVPVEEKKNKVINNNTSESEVNKYNYPKINITEIDNKNIINAFDYFHAILNRNKKLYYLTEFKQHRNLEKISYHETVFYNGNETKVELKEKYLDTYFHQKKEYLWNLINSVESDIYTSIGQISRVSLILNGKKGSGKSTFAFRAAMAMHRHIVNIDITLFKTKQDAFSGFDYGEKSIIVIDEFDKQLMTLKKREENITSVVLADGVKITEKEYISEDKFLISDLLGILQGVVCKPKQIIIATSNHYEIVKDICPELFRSGRLTLVEIDYLNKETIEKMYSYYFKTDIPINLDFLENGMTSTPTSELVEAAIYSKIINDPNYFLHKIN